MNSTDSSNAVSTAQPSSQLNVIPCRSSSKLLFNEPGGSGTGDDFKYADDPPLEEFDTARILAASILEHPLLREYPIPDMRHRSDTLLLSYMLMELGALAHGEGVRMVNQFASKTGAPLTHSDNSPIGKAALQADSFIKMRQSVEKHLAGQLSDMAAHGTIDCNALKLPKSAVPWVSFKFSDAWMLKAIIGGTQGRSVSLTALSLYPKKRKYDMTLRYQLIDDFGVDTSDLYTRGLIAFWILQHQRGYRPFKNIIDLTVTTSGTF